MSWNWKSMEGFIGVVDMSSKSNSIGETSRRRVQALRIGGFGFHLRTSAFLYSVGFAPLRCWVWKINGRACSSLACILPASPGVRVSPLPVGNESHRDRRMGGGCLVLSLGLVGGFRCRVSQSSRTATFQPHLRQEVQRRIEIEHKVQGYDSPQPPPQPPPPPVGR